MSAKLFNEPHEKEPPSKKTIRKIDDLILDAEKEAQAEIDRKLRSNNTKMLLVILAGVAMLYIYINGPKSLSFLTPPVLESDPQMAEVPPVPEPAPKPIPFPVAESDPTSETPEAASGSETDDTAKEPGPLESEAISMIQKNLNASEPAGPKVAESSPQDLAASETSITGSPKNKPELQADTAKPESGTRITSPKEVPKLSPEQSRYMIQVGAFAIKANADRVIKRLMAGGYSPLVQTRTRMSSMHVVFIGGFADEQNAQHMANALRQKGFEPSLKKNDNGSHSVILGQESSKDRAEALREKMTKQGIFTSLKEMNIQSRVYVVRVGEFSSNTSAQENKEKIEKLGYPGTFIRKKS